MTLVFATMLLLPRLSFAQSHAEGSERDARSTLRTFGLGLAGFVTGFVAHESGHFTANLAMGNVPQFKGLLVWGFLPFFSIAPRIDCESGERCTKHDGSEFGPGERGKYFIVSAGYHVQHVTDEIILTRAPELRYEDAPFRKALLTFNVCLSVMYAVGAWTGLEDPHGDLAGQARLSGMNETFLSFALLTPAAIDTYRYFRPSSARWSAWVSRGTKAAYLGLNFTF